jgi:hypothetical protein
VYVDLLEVLDHFGMAQRPQSGQNGTPKAMAWFTLESIFVSPSGKTVVALDLGGDPRRKNLLVYYTVPNISSNYSGLTVTHWNHG